MGGYGWNMIPCDERRLVGWLDGLNVMEYM
jgi:hypothetical protein